MAENTDFIDVDGEVFDPYNPIDTHRVEITEESLKRAKEGSIRAALERRQMAYKRVLTSMSEDAQIVLDDLMSFTFSGDTVFHENERIHVLLTGRQEVAQRINDHLRLSLDELVMKYTKPQT